MLKPNFLLTILLFSLFAFNAKANQDMTMIMTAKNVWFNHGNVRGTWDYHSAYILVDLLHQITKEQHKENIKIVINHNLPYYTHDYVLDPGPPQYDTFETKYNLAIGFDTNHVNPFTYGKPAPTIIIYYRGDFNTRKYILAVYYALNHLDEIKEKQKLIFTPYRKGSEKHFAVPETEFDFNYPTDSIIEKIIRQKTVNNIEWPREIFQHINFYYSDWRYHFVTVEKSVKKRNWAPALSDKYLLSIDEIYDVVSFENKDYLIFNSDTTFYHFDIDSRTSSGPYSIPYVNYYYEPHFKKHYITNGNLILEMYYKLNARNNDFITVTFDLKNKRVTSDYFNVKLRYELTEWFWKHRYYEGQPKPIPNDTAIYLLLSTLLLNSIAILVSSRKPV